MFLLQKHVGIARIINHRLLGVNFTDYASKQLQPDVIHVGNIPIELAYAVVKYAKLYSIPVIVDIRDLWPDIFDFIPYPLNGCVLNLSASSVFFTSFTLDSQ